MTVANGVTAKMCSVRRVPVINRAAALWTDIQLLQEYNNADQCILHITNAEAHIGWLVGGKTRVLWLNGCGLETKIVIYRLGLHCTDSI